ncbi:MAG: hypothetical protein ACK5RO_09865, partial [Pseudobdellovibrionaceae bacterium]
VLRRLRFDFEQEKTVVADRFKAERDETSKQMAALSANFERKLQDLAERTDQMTKDLGEELRLQMRTVVTEMAVLKSRVASVESGLKAAVEAVQTNRAKTFQLEIDMVEPRVKVTKALTSTARALSDIQIRFVKIVEPDDSRPDFYHDDFKPIMRACGGYEEASFPNALGLDSFQILAMEYARTLVLGERSGDPQVDQIFHGFGSALDSDGLAKTLLLAMVRYPVGSESETCLAKIQNWGRVILMKDSRFQTFRQRLADDESLARDIENIYEALSDLETPADQMDHLVQKSLLGLPNFSAALSALRVKMADDLVDHAQSTMALAERSQIFDEFADFQNETSQDRAESQRQINVLKAQLASFEVSTNQRLNQLQSEVGNLKLSVKRALDVIISLADRSGYPDLKAYTIWAGVPINAVPEVVPFWRPQIRQVQHFFSGPLSLKNKTDSCTGAKIDERTGGIQSLIQFGKWGPCWVNFRAVPQKAWGNEVKTFWLRVFGSATQINIKVDPSVQREQKALFAGYNYDKTFDFRNLAPNDPFLRLNGTLSRGVFDIRVPDILDYFCQKIRTWSGVTLTLTPIKTDVFDGAQAGGGSTSVETGAAFYYNIQLFSPLVIDFKKHGLLRTVPQNRSGVKFDLLGDGRRVSTGWVEAREGGLLALDLNRNGRIDGGRELFGEATLLSKGQRASNGFEALSVYDSNKDGMIDSKDRIHSKLLVWFDHNLNGLSEAGELVPLTQTRVQSINLAYSEVPPEQRMSSGNDLRFVSQSDVRFYDVFFGYRIEESAP